MCWLDEVQWAAPLIRLLGNGTLVTNSGNWEKPGLGGSEGMQEGLQRK